MVIAVDAAGGAEVVPAQAAELVHAGAHPRLTLADRCDACQAQAYVAVRLRATGRRLALCGHHYRRHEVALSPLVDAVHDQREDLEVRR